MQIVKPISEDEMILTFLTGELSSKRFGEKLRKSLKKFETNESIIKNPDLTNEKQNKLRKKVFSNYRGYEKNEDLFENFPSDVKWYRAFLNSKDLEKIKYVNYSYWNELSKGTRLAKIGAESVLEGIKVFNQSNQNFYETADEIKKEKMFPEVILFAKDKNSDPVILEGHVRLTALLMCEEYIPKDLEVIIGFSKNFDKWDI